MSAQGDPASGSSRSVLAGQIDLLARHARVYGMPELPIETGMLGQLARAVDQRDKLLAFASHRRGCLSTLPCSCGLDALLAQARATAGT